MNSIQDSGGQPGNAPSHWEDVEFRKAAGTAIAEVLPGAVVLGCRALSGGLSALMALIEIRGSDGQERKLVLRGHPGAAEEFRLLRMLREHGISVPAGLGLYERMGSPISPLLLMEYVEGRMDFSPPIPAGYGQAMGEALAEIHRVPLRAVGPLRNIRLEDLTGPRGGLPPGDPLGAEAVWRTLDFAGKPEQFGPVLLHSDFWPGNVLWDAGCLSAVIDWEDAGAGDPLMDLAIARLDLRWILGREAEEAFTEAYFARASRAYPQGLTAAVQRALAWWDLAAVLRLSRMAGADLESWAAFFHPYGREDITGEAIRRDVAMFTARARKRLAGR